MRDRASDDFPQTEAYQRGQVSCPWHVGFVLSPYLLGIIHDHEIYNAHVSCCLGIYGYFRYESRYSWSVGRPATNQYRLPILYHERPFKGSVSLEVVIRGTANTEDEALAAFWHAIEELTYEPSKLPA